MTLHALRVVDPDADWPGAFQREARQISQACGRLPVAIHHIGSTAVPGLSAKPIIDILLETSAGSLDGLRTGMERLGYESMGEYGITGRRYFRKNSPQGIRTHHVHAFQQGDPHVERHLAFRDYLIAHEDIARAYSILKRELAARYPEDMQAYMNGKDPFIKMHEADALAWANGGRNALPISCSATCI